MNFLFLLLSCPDLDRTGSLYSDLALACSRGGHYVTIVTRAAEGQDTGMYKEAGITLLRVKTPRHEGVKSFWRKGFALVMMPFLYKRAYKHYLKDSPVDVIFMPTPPVTFINCVTYIKKRTRARFYLILRDIHPQCFHRKGIHLNPLADRYLSWNAQRAYAEADYIGCMSPQNMSYLQSIAPDIEPGKIVLLPNWLHTNEYVGPDPAVRIKYGLSGKVVAVFGGTIGLAQGVENLIRLAKHYRDNPNVVFLIVGNGIRKDRLVKMADEYRLSNMRFLDSMPRDEYESLLRTADIGLVSLDTNYRVPTCPSKVIEYMAMKVPVIAMINRNNDFGSFYIDRSKIGFWSDDMDSEKVYQSFDRLLDNPDLRRTCGEQGYVFYRDHFTAEEIYRQLMQQLNSNGE